MHLGREVWNSKKWRALLFLNSDRRMVISGRHYPFAIPQVMPEISAILENLEIVSQSLGQNWTECLKFNNSIRINDGGTIIEDNYELTIPYVIIHGYAYPLSDFIVENENRCYYNDLLHSTCYSLFIQRSYWYGRDYFKNHPVEVGKDAYCICCGEKVIIDTDLMVCEDCALTKTKEDSDRFFTCPICGEREYRDCGHWTYTDDNCDEMLVCRNCYQEN